MNKQTDLERKCFLNTCMYSKHFFIFLLFFIAKTWTRANMQVSRQNHLSLSYWESHAKWFYLSSCIQVNYSLKVGNIGIIKKKFKYLHEEDILHYKETMGYRVYYKSNRKPFKTFCPPLSFIKMFVRFVHVTCNIHCTSLWTSHPVVSSYAWYYDIEQDPQIPEISK
jgi:hypothetical protein